MFASDNLKIRALCPVFLFRVFKHRVRMKYSFKGPTNTTHTYANFFLSTLPQEVPSGICVLLCVSGRVYIYILIPCWSIKTPFGFYLMTSQLLPALSA